jgi:hypothetical protein
MLSEGQMKFRMRFYPSHHRRFVRIPSDFHAGTMDPSITLRQAQRGGKGNGEKGSYATQCI